MSYLSTMCLVLSKNGQEQLDFVLDNLKTKKPDVYEKAKKVLYEDTNLYDVDKENKDVIYKWVNYYWDIEGNEAIQYLNRFITDLIMNPVDSKDVLWMWIGDSIDDTSIDGLYYNNSFHVRLTRDITTNRKEKMDLHPSELTAIIGV